MGLNLIYTTRSGDGIGIRAGFKIQILWVRGPPGAPRFLKEVV
jgi:hypothetical protein